MAADKESLVCEIIDKDKQQWDMQRIKAIFPENVVSGIQGIPLRKANADVLIWDCKEKGCYTVKSGYRLLMGSKEEVSRSQGEENVDQRGKLCRFRKKLWAAKVPSKVKMSIWRISHDFLPVLAYLYKKKVCPQPIYVV